MTCSITFSSKTLRLAAILITTMVLSSCGFHLRGSGTELPAHLQTLRISSADPGNGVFSELQEQLRAQGVNIVESGPGPELTLDPELIEERIVSLNSSARAGEYLLMLEVAYRLDQAGETVAGPETLSAEQIYQADPENTIAKDEEATIILNELREQLARRIISQLSRLQN